MKLYFLLFLPRILNLKGSIKPTYLLPMIIIPFSRLASTFPMMAITIRVHVSEGINTSWRGH